MEQRRCFRRVVGSSSTASNRRLLLLDDDDVPGSSSSSSGEIIADQFSCYQPEAAMRTSSSSLGQSPTSTSSIYPVSSTNNKFPNHLVSPRQSCNNCCCCSSSTLSSSSPSSSNHRRPFFFSSRQLFVASSSRHSAVLVGTLLLTVLLSTFPASSLAYDASYTVVAPMRTGHICFLRPTVAREDRVSVERWFFNTSSRNCESYLLELNIVDMETRSLLNDFPTFRACNRFCSKIVRNLTDAEIEERVREGLVYVNDAAAASPPPSHSKSRPRLVESGGNDDVFVPAPTIVVSNVDAKARREHSGSLGGASNTLAPSSYSRDNNKDDQWSSQTVYKNSAKNSMASTSASPPLRHHVPHYVTFLLALIISSFSSLYFNFS